MDRAELREAGESILRRETGSDLVRRLCPRCGSSQHGRPSVRGGAHVSLSYADGLVAVAWSTSGPVGIDVELGDRVEWTRLEALLKAAGEGVTQQPTDRPDLPDLPTRELRLPEGYVGTVAGDDVSWRLAGPATPPSAATS